MPLLSIAVPACNEERCIGATIEAIRGVEAAKNIQVPAGLGGTTGA